MKYYIIARNYDQAKDFVADGCHYVGESLAGFDLYEVHPEQALIYKLDGHYIYNDDLSYPVKILLGIPHD